MANKFQANATVKCFYINIHSLQIPQIINAVCKGGTLEDAKEVARTLYVSSKAPYVVYIKDGIGNTLFKIKIA